MNIRIINLLIVCIILFIVLFIAFSSLENNNLSENQIIDFLESNTDEGQNIAIIDSGVSELVFEEYEHLIIGTYNSIDGSDIVADEYGHGTEMFCIIVCQLNYGSAIYEFDGNIIVIKAFDGFGKTSTEYLILAIKYCINNDVDIINLSFGKEKFDKELDEVIMQAKEKGIILITPFRKVSKNLLLYPGTSEYTLSINYGKKRIFSIKTDVNFYIPITGPSYDIVTEKHIEKEYTSTSEYTAFYTRLISNNNIIEESKK